MGNATNGVALGIAVIGLLGAATGALINGHNSAKLDAQKFASELELRERQFESDLIIDALARPDPVGRAKYLTFLIDSGLVTSLDGDRIRCLAAQPDELPWSGQGAAGVATSLQSLAAAGATIGGIEAVDTNQWEFTATLNNVNVVGRRADGDGRVIAVSHDGMLADSGKERFWQQSFRWLLGERLNGRVGLSASHSEWFPNQYGVRAEALGAVLKCNGMSVTKVVSELSPKVLAELEVLVIGNAWSELKVAEVAAVVEFVHNGGGLLMAGLGWSWASNRGSDMASYPMNQLGQKFNIKWLPEQVKIPL